MKLKDQKIRMREKISMSNYNRIRRKGSMLASSGWVVFTVMALFFTPWRLIYIESALNGPQTPRYNEAAAYDVFDYFLIAKITVLFPLRANAPGMKASASLWPVNFMLNQ